MDYTAYNELIQKVTDHLKENRYEKQGQRNIRSGFGAVRTDDSLPVFAGT